MATVRVLIAEDEPSIRGLLVHHLKREGFVALEAADGTSALRSARAGIEVAVLDIGLPGIDGLEVLRALRREGRDTPVMLLSARCDEVDRIVGFELGADDYVVKPFFMREVVSRLRRFCGVRATRRRPGLRCCDSALWRSMRRRGRHGPTGRILA